MADNKSTDAFRDTIEEHLKMRAFKNPLFAEKFSNPDKSIDECVKYILNRVEKSGKNGFTDDEIYSMAIHYYSEKNVSISTNKGMKVVVNHKKLLNSEERAKAKEEAYNQLLEEEKKKILNKNKPKKSPKKDDDNGVKTLF